jgi:hypothetical protein
MIHIPYVGCSDLMIMPLSPIKDVITEVDLSGILAFFTRS